jgi:cysteine desulfurase
MKQIYLDNNATTFLSPAVIQAISREIGTLHGNPSSIHYFGRAAKSKLLKAKDLIANFLQVTSQEILLTSGGTEGINLFLHQLPQAHESEIITSATEHKATLSCMKQLEMQGAKIHYLTPATKGTISSSQILQKMTKHTKMIFLSLVNNETGTALDLQQLGTIAKEYQIPLVIDAVAALGKYPFIVEEGVSGMIFSGHKIHAPAGSGFVLLRKGTKIAPLIIGGGQELGRRGGTENLIGTIGLATAIQELHQGQSKILADIQMMRDAFETKILNTINQVYVNGSEHRSVNTSNLFFSDVDGELLLMKLDQLGVCASMGSACSSGGLEPSHVLTAMGFSKERIHGSLRFSFSKLNTLAEALEAAEIVCKVVSQLRKFTTVNAS